MELVKEKSFPVNYETHKEILEKVELVQGHLNVILYALQGLIERTDGDIGPYKALEGVTDSAIDFVCELQNMIHELRD